MGRRDIDGSLTRLIDPDTTLRAKIIEFIGRGDFGLTSGARSGGTFDRIWYKEVLPPDEIAFEAGVFLLTKVKAKSLTQNVPVPQPKPIPETPMEPIEPKPEPKDEPVVVLEPVPQTKTLHISGTIPPNFGTVPEQRSLP